ncbi:MAG: hypothetical protein ABEJ98_00350 [Candidatus Nanohaloarchaea archaeon]
MRSKQQKLEHVLDRIEMLERLASRPNPTVWSKDIADGKAERTEAGKVLSYLQDLDCIEKYFGREDSNRYDTQSFDLERLQNLAQLFRPEKSERLESLAAKPKV